MLARARNSPDSGTCTACSRPYKGRPNKCRGCGRLLNDVVEDVRRLAKVGRTKIQKQKSLADIMFLIALLVGGPVMTVGGDVQTGLFIVLAGGLSSALRRYSSWSTPGTVLVGSVLALIGATLLVDTALTGRRGGSRSVRVGVVGPRRPRRDAGRGPHRGLVQRPGRLGSRVRTLPGRARAQTPRRARISQSRGRGDEPGRWAVFVPALSVVICPS